MRVLAVAVAVLLSGCAGTPGDRSPDGANVAKVSANPDPDEARSLVVAVGGTSSGIPVLEHFAAAFERTNPDVDVAVLVGFGSSNGIKAVKNGTLDFSVAARKLRPAEDDGNVVATPWFTEAIVLFVSRDAGIDRIAGADLRAILEGKIRSWAELGGADVPIVAVSRDPAEDVETRMAMAAIPSLENVTFAPSVRIVGSDPEKLEALSATPGAVGFANAALVGFVGAPVTPLAVEGVVFSPRALASGEYPLTTSFHLMASPGLSGEARAFHDSLLGTEARSRIALAQGLQGS